LPCSDTSRFRGSVHFFLSLLHTLFAWSLFFLLRASRRPDFFSLLLFSSFGYSPLSPWLSTAGGVPVFPFLDTQLTHLPSFLAVEFLLLNFLFLGQILFFSLVWLLIASASLAFWRCSFSLSPALRFRPPTSFFPYQDATFQNTYELSIFSLFLTLEAHGLPTILSFTLDILTVAQAAHNW